MASIDLNSSSSVCRKCGRAYGRLKGNFPVSYASLYKGVGYLPYCKSCIDDMYDAYYAECNDQRKSVRQMCRKLDLYWNEGLYNNIDKQNTPRTIMTSYISKITSVKWAGRSFDDTLRDEGRLWNYNMVPNVQERQIITQSSEDAESIKTDDDYDPKDISDDIKAFWGPGYTSKMYKDLEQRRSYWMSKIPDSACVDIGQEALIRQICCLEIDINRDRASGKAIDKSVGALNTLLGSMNLKPVQKNDSDMTSDSMPYGVWIRKLEDTRPVSDPDPELSDVDGIIRYISIWFLGHLCKMLHIKNTYCKLYEEEIEKLRVSKPEYTDEDDESIFNSEFSGYGCNDE